jgi:hypothetical protein
VAAIAIVVIDAAPRHLLRVEPQFGVTLAALDIAAGDGREENDRQQNRLQIADCRFQNLTSGGSTILE